MLTTSNEKADLRQWANERGLLNIEIEALLDRYDDFRAWQAKKIEDRIWPHKVD